MNSTTLLVFVSDVVGSNPADVDLEGRQITTRKVVDDLGADVSGRLVRVTRLPRCLLWVAVTLFRIFDRQQEEFLAFPDPVVDTDAKTPQCGPYASHPHIPWLWSER